MVFELERRLVRQGAILIKDSNLARAAWIRSILQRFVTQKTALFVSPQRFDLRRRSDILVPGDPLAYKKDESNRRQPAVTTLRYTLTKRAWQTNSSVPQGATVMLLTGDLGIASTLRNALAQL
jgi:hypothetical protein